MFVAWRDLRFAKGRFVLIGSVVALITLLVGFLSGLTGGLAVQNISGVLSLPADQVVFSAPGNDNSLSFSDSQITEEQSTEWAAASGVESALPVGITQSRAEVGDTRIAIALYGVEPGFDAASPARDGEIGLSLEAAQELGVAVGDTVTIAGSDYEVSVVEGDWWYTHTPVVQMTITDWRAYSAATGSPEAFATVLAVTGSPDLDAVNESASTVSKSPLMSLTALSSFKSEIGSLLLMVAMLFGISALVIGAFFTVWTIQRHGDIAILKALGASTRSLVLDALGQALVVLLIGVGVGISLVVVLGLLAGTALPFVISPLTTVLPAVVMIALGLAGAAFALRPVTTADPLTALGSNR